MQITLRPLTESAEDQIKEHGSDWIIKKFHPMVHAFKGPGCWVESIKSSVKTRDPEEKAVGMWLRCSVDMGPDKDKMELIIDDPDYKHLV